VVLVCVSFDRSFVTWEILTSRVHRIVGRRAMFFECTPGSEVERGITAPATAIRARILWGRGLMVLVMDHANIGLFISQSIPAGSLTSVFKRRYVIQLSEGNVSRRSSRTWAWYWRNPDT
jgi:hypothetical protein